MDMSQLEQLQSFRAATMREALEAVRASLGDDAIIVETRRVSEQGPRKGWRRGDLIDLVEVTAGREPVPEKREIWVDGTIGDGPTRSTERRFADETYDHDIDDDGNDADYGPEPDRMGSESRGGNRSRQPSQPLRTETTQPASSKVEGVFDETPLAERLAAIEEALRSLTRDRRGHGPIVDRLANRGVPVGLARDVVREAASDDPMSPPGADALSRQLARLLKTEVDPPVQGGVQRRIALVGPTGAGKTTTLAKLAAGYRIKHGLSVGLITVDDYRVAAADQLRTYAELIQCPIRIVGTDDEMRHAMVDLEACDVVLIDTAGLGHPDDEQLAALDRRLSIAGVQDRYFVVSVCNTLASTRAAFERYRILRPTAAIYTKLDETPEPGIVVGIAHEVSLPVRYVTNGQEVPRDLHVANAMEIAQEIVEIESQRMTVNEQRRAA